MATLLAPCQLCMPSAHPPQLGNRGRPRPRRRRGSCTLLGVNVEPVTTQDCNGLLEVPSCCVWHLSILWPELDLSSQGLWPSRAAYGVQLCQDEGAVGQLDSSPPRCVALQTFLLHMTWSVCLLMAIFCILTGLETRRKSFASLILNTNLWMRVTVAACYREQIHKGIYPKAWY